MGAGTDTEKGAPPNETPLQPPPVYTEKEPLPSSDPVVVPIGRSEPPIVSQRDRCRERCQRRRGRCCCYCCTILVVLILCCTVLPIAIVAITKDMWTEPFVDIKFSGSSSHVGKRFYNEGNNAYIRCDVDFKTRYVPLVQWFHRAEENRPDGSSGYKLFAVHNEIRDEFYKERYEVVRTRTKEGKLEYEMIIRNVQMEDAGRYVCQVPKASRRINEYQDSDSDSDSDSSSDDDDDDDDDDDNDDDDDESDNDRHRDNGRKKGCFYKGRRSDYVYLGVRK